nr:GGDEF domain-containing protein [Massilia sp. TS11]
MTDSLTGVANRRCLDETIDSEWRRCARMGEPIALILADIDHFKLYNDEYGHQAGDACLQAVASAMRRAAARPQDLVARYGGEEFAILLPMLDVRGAEVVANKLLAEIELLAIPHARSSTAPSVTLSLGVAALRPADGAHLDSLLKTADALLYQAKSLGRNRCCLPL